MGCGGFSTMEELTAYIGVWFVWDAWAGNHYCQRGIILTAKHVRLAIMLYDKRSTSIT